MTQKDKDLLLQILCAELPYNVYVKTKRFDFPIELRYISLDKVPEVKPYLRSMSSMTVLERQEYGLVLCGELSINQYDWLNAHHFDYRGAIEKGVALEAPEGMYNI